MQFHNQWLLSAMSFGDYAGRDGAQSTPNVRLRAPRVVERGSKGIYVPLNGSDVRVRVRALAFSPGQAA